MPYKMTLHMQQDDIDSAIICSRQHCAIAQTIYRELKVSIGRVRVTAAGVSIAKDDHRYLYKQPESAARLVRDFDDHKPVKPIIFSLHLALVRPITPVDPEQKSRINKNRRERDAALAALGQKPKKYARGRYAV